MSDEPPSSLRLKPRLKAEADSAASADPAAGAGGKVGEEGGMKIRLRPKMPAEPTPDEAAAEQLTPTVPHSPDDITPQPEPVAEPEPAQPLSETPAQPLPSEGPKFRLKTRAGDAGAAHATPPGGGLPASAEGDPANPSPMPLDPAAEMLMNIPVPVSPLYVPTVETPATESFRLDLSPAPPPVPLVPEEPAPPPPSKPRSFRLKGGTISLIAAVVFILGCGAFFVHRVVTQPSAARPLKQKTRIKSIPVVAEPTPVPTPTPTPVPLPEEVRPRTVNNQVTTAIAPGISVTSSSSVEAVNASPAFRSWVAAARISGVFQGATPRALINGRTIRAGTVADEGLGITFQSIDAENKMIVFKDRAGAEVSRRY